MSLQVWLPLNGDLQNKGLSDIQASVIGSNTWPDGKIGSKSFQGGTGTQVTNGIQLNNNMTDLLSGDYSVAVWIKPTGTHVHYNGAIFSSGNWNNKAYSFGVSQDNSKIDVLCNRYNTYINCQVPINQWTHICCTRKGNLISLYKNGIFINSLTRQDSPQSDNLTVSTIGRESYANGYFSFNGQLNDFRLYDHALSIKQIKELAKGLVLHYPLDNNGLGGQNLLPCGGTYTKDSPWTTTLSRVDGYAWVTGSAFEAEPSTTYTISVECDGTLSDRHGTGQIPIENKPFTFWLNLSNINTTKNWQAGAYDAAQILTSTNNNYRKIGNTHVWTYTLSDTRKYISLRTNSYSDGTIESTVNWWNMKIEKGDKFTPWIPNKTSSIGTVIGLNDTTIYDCSGYQNNGTLNNITYSIDTPKYSSSSQFTTANTSYIKVNENKWMAQHTKEMTINFWAYAENWTTQTSTHLFSCTQGGGFNTQKGNSGYLKFPIYVCTNEAETTYAYKFDSQELKLSDLTSGWHMFTYIYQAKTGTKTYVDGNLHHTYSNVSYGIRFNTNARLFLGCQAAAGNPSQPYFNGKESDFRLYYTVLSEDDIKELYSVRASGDRDSNFYSSGKFIEEEQKSITKQGITKSLLYEIGLPVRYIRDTTTGSSANSNNHWCEIQIFNILNQNIALHKDVTFTKDSTSSTYSNSVVTDGTINSSYLPSGWGNTTSALIDLGQTQNVTKIKIWHYYPDGRTYHNNITQVSIDGENWTTVYSTLISGEKAQTVNGNEILLSPDKIFYTRDNYLYTNSFIEN